MYKGDFGGASSYLNRARDINPENKTISLAMAAIHLKRSETDKALKMWLKILDDNPKDRTAKKGLNTVRKLTQQQKLTEFINSERIYKIFPPHKKNIIPDLIKIGTAIIAFLLIAFGGYYAYTEYFNSEQTTRKGSEHISIQDMDNEELTQYEGNFTYILKPEEIRSTLRKADKYFNNFRDNMAQREINRILFSNASPAIKEKANMLASYIDTPDFTEIRDSFAYKEVKSEPKLYNNCFVVWKGKVTNINIGKSNITFDLLVGYEDEKVLEGVVPVTLNFAADLYPGFPIELLGQVVLNNEKSSSQSIQLKGISIHTLSPGDS